MKFKREIFDLQPVLNHIENFMKEIENEKEETRLLKIEEFFPNDQILQKNILEILKKNLTRYETIKLYSIEMHKKILTELIESEQINKDSLFLYDDKAIKPIEYYEKISKTFHAEIYSNLNPYKKKKIRNIFIDIDVEKKKIYDFPDNSLESLMKMLKNANEEDKIELIEQLKENMDYISEKLRENSIKLTEIEEVVFYNHYSDREYKRHAFHHFLVNFKDIPGVESVLSSFFEHAEFKDIIERTWIKKEKFRDSIYESEQFAYKDIIGENYNRLNPDYFIKLFNKGFLKELISKESDFFSQESDIFTNLVGRALKFKDYDFINNFLNACQIKDLSECVLLEHKNLFTYCNDIKDLEFLEAKKYPFYQLNHALSTETKSRLNKKLDEKSNENLIDKMIDSRNASDLSTFLSYIKPHMNEDAILYLNQNNKFNFKDESAFSNQLIENILKNKSLNFIINFEKITGYPVYDLDLSYKLKPSLNEDCDKKEKISENFMKAKPFRHYRSFFESIQPFKDKTVSILKYLHKNKQLDILSHQNVAHILEYSNKQVSEMYDSFIDKKLLEPSKLFEKYNHYPLIWNLNLTYSSAMSSIFRAEIKKNKNILYSENSMSYVYFALKKNYKVSDIVNKLKIQNKIDFSFTDSTYGHIYQYMLKKSKQYLAIDDFKKIIKLDKDPIHNFLNENNGKNFLQELNETELNNSYHVIKEFINHIDIRDERILNRKDNFMNDVLAKFIPAYSLIYQKIKEKNTQDTKIDMDEIIIDELHHKDSLSKSLLPLLDIDNNIIKTLLSKRDNKCLIEKIFFDEITERLFQNFNFKNEYLYQNDNGKPHYEIFLEKIEKSQFFKDGKKVMVNDMEMSWNDLFAILNNEYIQYCLHDDLNQETKSNKIKKI